MVFSLILWWTVERLLVRATLVVLIVAGAPLQGQQAAAANNAVVPMQVQFSGVLSNSNGKPLTGITGTGSLFRAPIRGSIPS